LNRWAYVSAAKKGRVNVLKWLYENGCLLNEAKVYMIIDAATLRCDVDMMKWAQSVVVTKT